MKNEKNPLSAILHAGDLSYADFNQTRWDTWGRLVSPLAATVPYMVCPGNHEIEVNDQVNLPFVAYQNRFQMPFRESGATGGNLYYSFTLGLVHFIFLTPYAPSHSHSDQYRWLLQNVQNVNRRETPWIIVIMHAPWYNSNIAHQDIQEPQYEMKENMEPLFMEYKIDLVFAGRF